MEGGGGGLAQGGAGAGDALARPDEGGVLQSQGGQPARQFAANGGQPGHGHAQHDQAARALVLQAAQRGVEIGGEIQGLGQSDARQVARVLVRGGHAGGLRGVARPKQAPPPGGAVAASNRDQPTPTGGENYSNRPYYRLALAQGRGRFYGIGMTTGVPGYYLSQAIEEDGKRLGVVVIKVELSALEQEWLSSPDVVLASDDHDVVFLANRDNWRYRRLRPLGADDRREMLDARQYADRALQPLRARTEDVLADGGRMVRLLDPALAGTCTCCTTPALPPPPAVRRR
ncbi:hypothetical protein G6F68_011282 [Rhizopus microsporus]|nr:hypothetical protein G6F68_011282 [Rhizopus microsporus]